MSGRAVRDESPVSFLSRLRGERPDREPHGDDRFARELAAVTRNLRAVLGSRKGCSVVTDLGLGDYDGREERDGVFQPHIAASQILAVLIPEIEQAVRRFEPRLLDPAVERATRDEALRAIFVLRGVLSGRRVRFRVSLHTVFRNVEIEVLPGLPIEEA